MTKGEAQKLLRGALGIVSTRSEVSAQELVQLLGLVEAGHEVYVSRKRSVAGRARVESAVREGGRFAPNKPPAQAPPPHQQTTSTSPAHGPAPEPVGEPAPPAPPSLPLSLPVLNSGFPEESPADSVAPKDLEASAREGERRPTVVPLNLVEKARVAGVFEMLRDGLERAGRRVTLAQLEDAAREFVSYWSIGEGMGREHTSWMRKMREHVRRSALADRLSAPGAIEHAENRRAQAEDDRVLRLVREGAQREQREREAAGGVVIVSAPAQAPRRRAADHGEQVALARNALASLRGPQRDGGAS